MLAGTAAAGFFMWQTSSVFKSLLASTTPAAASDEHRAPASAAPAGEHGAKAPAGEGHGAKPAEGGGHGAPAAEGHGAPPAEGGGHGGGAAAAAAPATPHGAPTLVSIDQVVSNLRNRDGDDAPVHSVWMKLEIELFGDDGRPIVEKRQAGIRDIVIQAAREQEYRNLASLPGKLYFKETLVSRINGYLKTATVRDIHFSDFLIQ